MPAGSGRNKARGRGADALHLTRPEATQVPMLDIKLFRNDPARIKDAIAARGGDPAAVDEVVRLDEAWRAAALRRDELRNLRKVLSKEIGQSKDPELRAAKMKEVEAAKEELEQVEAQEQPLAEQRDALLLALPNLLDEATPRGHSEDENVVIETVGAPPALGFAPRTHWDLGSEQHLIDFDRGVKISGSRFYVLRGDLARMQRGLIAWLLNFHSDNGYRELYLPFAVRGAALRGAGQLPKFADNLYHDAEEDFWMVPTAEVPITGYHADEILDEEQLPLRYCAYTPCFRREKVSHGRDVRGIKRGHQFDKVELYQLTRPEDSAAALEEMRAHVARLCEALGLHYRVKALCSADIGFASQKTYDFEAWAPGCQEWLEISSVSNCRDFQARRANLRYREASTRKPELLHTLNGSGLGLPRTLICLLESHQRADGSIGVPAFLQPFVGTDVLRPA